MRAPRPRLRRLPVAAAALALAASLSGGGCAKLLGFEDVTLGTGGGGSGTTTTSGTSSCVDTQTSAEHCGACGHSCLGGACEKGVCQPAPLAVGIDTPTGLAVRGGVVYFTAQREHTVYRVAEPGTQPDVVADDTEAYFPGPIAVDESLVYWGNAASPDGSLRACPLAGCRGTAAKVIAEQAFEPTAIALDGTSIYWVEHDGGTVMRADRGTGLNPKLLFPASEGAWPFDLAVAGGAVYFVDDHAVDVRRVPAGGGAATIVASGESASQGIAVAGSTVFFSATGQGDGVLWSAPLDGSAKATAFAELQEDPVGVAVDGANVYWVACGDTHSATGLVLSCPLTGCGAPGPRVLAKGQSYPWKVVVDERAVYWVNRGLPSGPLGSRERGAVLRLAK